MGVEVLVIMEILVVRKADRGSTLKSAKNPPIFRSISEIQWDLDEYLAYYNLERSSQGYHVKGRALTQACMKILDTPEQRESPFS